MELKELVNRDMATRLMIRAKREAFCRRQNGLRNTLGDDSGALVPHLLPLPRDGAPQCGIGLQLKAVGHAGGGEEEKGDGVRHD